MTPISIQQPPIEDASASPPTPSHSKLEDSLRRELEAMREAGMRVPKKAFAMASDPVRVKQYEGMRVVEAAELIVSLASLR